MPLGVPLSEVVVYLDQYLRIREIPDDPRALNGLQVENTGMIGSIVAAVDASQATIDGVVAGLKTTDAVSDTTRDLPIIPPKLRDLSALVEQSA